MTPARFQPNGEGYRSVPAVMHIVTHIICDGCQFRIICKLLHKRDYTIHRMPLIYEEQYRPKHTTLRIPRKHVGPIELFSIQHDSSASYQTSSQS